MSPSSSKWFFLASSSFQALAGDRCEFNLVQQRGENLERLAYCFRSNRQGEEKQKIFFLQLFRTPKKEEVHAWHKVEGFTGDGTTKAKSKKSTLCCDAQRKRKNKIKKVFCCFRFAYLRFLFIQIEVLRFDRTR